ncbi:uncharacterized protein rab11fip1a isoform X1 [Salminus brasiliensis]|uniref:uncharacterized protein rab11fip1a isoform X1 n=1 Tax=Salminus brasiliensis TaxID=930266 RepID=UPI003B835A8D
MSFSDFHSSVAPPKPQRTFTESPRGSMENLASGEYTANMSGKNHRDTRPPSYPGDLSKNGASGAVSATSQQRPPLPLPDYEVLFPKKRHGVMTSTRWEHIIAEVNQRKIDSHLPHIREEMSVDGPNEAVPKKSPSFDQQPKDHPEKSSAPKMKTEPKQALIPPKQALVPPKQALISAKQAPVQPKPTRQMLEVNSEKVHTPEPVYATVDKSNRFAAKLLGTDTRQRLQSGPELQEKEKRTLDTSPENVFQSPETNEKPTPVARAVKKSNSQENSNSDEETTELPLAKPRQRASSKEPVRAVQPEQPTPRSSALSESAQVEGKKGPMTSRSLWENTGSDTVGKVSGTPDTARTDEMAKTQSVADVSKDPEKRLMNSDPFPNDKLISHDPWALPQQSVDQDDPFTGGPPKAKDPKGLGLSPEDFESVFGGSTPTFSGSVADSDKKDPFSGSVIDEKDPFFGSSFPKGKKDPFFGSSALKDQKDPFFGSSASNDQKDLFFGSVESTGKNDPFFGSIESTDKNDPFFGAVGSSKKDESGLEESSPAFQKGYSQRKRQAPQPPVSLEKSVSQKRVVDKPVPQFVQDPEDVELTVTSVAEPHSGENTMATSKADLWGMDPFAPPSQALSTSATPEPGLGGRTMLRAWVSPSEVQSISSQSGGSGALIPRRPHPVKPLSSTESQPPSSISVSKDLKAPTIREVAEKSKTVDSGPYTQLTQEELITLVVKQQTELSKKDAKILELEDYIDNLLVRVIDEKPSILLALNSKA